MYSQSVPKCFLDVQCSVLYHCNPVFSPTVHRKQEFLERQEFFAQLAATMMYYAVVEMMTPGLYLKHYLLNAKTYLHPCSLSTRRHVPREAGNRYTCTAKRLDSSTDTAGAVLKIKRSDHTTVVIYLHTEYSISRGHF